MSKTEHVLVVFRTRLDEAARSAYEPMAKRMVELAEQQPGYLGIKTFVAEDGERVSISEFESMEAAMAWRNHPEHQKAQELGMSMFYLEYELITCQPLRHSHFKREPN